MACGRSAHFIPAPWITNVRTGETIPYNGARRRHGEWVPTNTAPALCVHVQGSNPPVIYFDGSPSGQALIDAEIVATSPPDAPPVIAGH
jgi:hypothetical protein